MRRQHTVESLKTKYEHEIQAIENRMTDMIKIGLGDYYRHRLELFRQFVAELETIEREQGKE